jgi:hypothetical protein
MLQIARLSATPDGVRLVGVLTIEATKGIDVGTELYYPYFNPHRANLEVKGADLPAGAVKGSPTKR